MLKLVGNLEDLKKLCKYYGDETIEAIIHSNLTSIEQSHLKLIKANYGIIPKHRITRIRFSYK